MARRGVGGEECSKKGVTLCVRSSMAWAKVAMPPMAVPTRIPHRILSTLSMCSLSMAMFAASSACSK